MSCTPEIEAAAKYIEAEALAVRSSSGLAVSPSEISFAAQRLCAAAAGLRAGLHVPDLPLEEPTDG